MADPVLRPLEAISSLFQSAGEPVDGASDFGVAQFFQSALTQDALAKVRSEGEVGSRTACAPPLRALPTGALPDRRIR